MTLGFNRGSEEKTLCMNHICLCQKCRDAIVEVVQGVLEDDMDLDAGGDSSREDTDETIEYDQDESDQEDKDGGLNGHAQ